MVRVPYLQEMPIYGNLAQKKSNVAEKPREVQQSDIESDLHCAGFCSEYRSGKWLKELACQKMKFSNQI